MRIVLPSFDPDLYLLDCQRFVHIWGMKQIPFRILLWIKYNVLVGNNQNFLFFCGVRKEHLQLFITLYCRKSQNKPEIDLYSISGIKKNLKYEFINACTLMEGFSLERKMIFHVVLTRICLSVWLGCFPSWLPLVAFLFNFGMLVLEYCLRGLLVPSSSSCIIY